MKKSITIFAAAALLIAASCTKEIAPAGTEVSLKGNEFTASFEQVKTTLDNYTPVWVEGDAIGITTADDANVKCPIKDVSTGTFDADAVKGSEPYCAVYPYSETNTFSGDVLTASVPSVQQLVAGQSVAPGAMVTACKSNSRSLSLKNCVGLLKLTLPGDKVKKVVVAATKAGQKISGQFTMDLSAETLAPTAAGDADSTVTLLPVGTSFEAGSYYVAVIPDTLSAFKITFTDTGDQTVTVTKSASLPLTRSVCIDLGQFFTYKLTTAAEMIKWAKQAAKFTTWDCVTLENDITFTDAEAAQYVEANKFCGIFDGQNHKVTGLTNAVFGDLQGTVKNLELESDIVTNLKKTSSRTGSYTYGTGILAHYFKKELRTDAYVDNVITRGSLKLSGASVANAHQVGGLAGASNGVPVSNCKNYASIEVDGITYTKSGALAVAGCIGTAQSAVATYKNLENYGTVTLKSVTQCDSTANAFVGGVIGYHTQANKLDACKNYGNVTVNGPISGKFGYLVAGGVSGHSTGAGITLTNCVNEAVVSNEANITATNGDNYCYTGGVAGNFDKNVVMTDCSNSGAVYDKIADATNPKTHYLAGCVGRAYADSKLTRCTNSGAVEYASSAVVGVVACGIIGYINTSATITDCINTGNISESTAFATAVDVRMAGIAANVTGSKPSTALEPKVTFSGCRNEGSLTVRRQLAGTVYAGGIIAGASQYLSITGCTNTGDIASFTPCTNIYAGGIYGSMSYGFSIASCVNTGDVTNTGTVTGTNRIGGIVGNGCCMDPIKADGKSGWAQSTYSKISDCDNSGTIRNESASTAVVRLGGILGSSTNGAVEVLSCDNRGDVTNKMTAGTLKNAQLGGISGYMGNINGKIDQCTTKCTVSSTGTVTTCYAAAVLGQCGTGSTFTLSNTALAGTVSGSTVTSTNGTVTAENYASHIYAYKNGGTFTNIGTCSFLDE